MKNAEKLDDITKFLKEIVSEEIKEPVESIGEDQHFFEFGFDSINSLYLMERIEKHFEIEINQLYFWDYPTIRSFSEFLFQEKNNL